MKNLLFFSGLSLGILFWSIWIIVSHPQHAIVSWDEGFHGGAALFISEGIRNYLNFGKFTYILNDFKNGLVWYPPLWLFVAGPLGAIFGPSVQIYRFSTLVFSILSIYLAAAFTRKIQGVKAAIITVVTLAFVPVFVVYSHLMMIEVPLLFSVGFALSTFLIYLNKEKTSRSDYLWTSFAMVIGVMAKIVGVAIIFGTLTLYGAILFLFYRKNVQFRRFFSGYTLVILSCGLLTLQLYRAFDMHVLHADLLNFHINQTEQLTGHSGNILKTLVQTLKDNLGFYLTDFLHMLPVTILLIGSLIGYLVLDRSLLSIFLLAWVVTTYLVFSSVKPQAVQYVMSIFLPLAIATGLFWGRFLNLRNKITGNICFVSIAAGILVTELLFQNQTETWGWRNLVTNQDQAAQYVSEHANFGDRVISIGDGTRFLVRLFGFKKNLQTINGAAPICQESIQDSTEWLISDLGPQNPIQFKDLHSNWVRLASYSGVNEPTMVFKNTNDTSDLKWVANNLIGNRCVRFFLPGLNLIKVTATPHVKNAELLKTGMFINLKVNPLKKIKELKFDQQTLLHQDGLEQKYQFTVDQHSVNQPLYFVFNLPQGLTLDVKQIAIKNMNR